MTATTEQVTPIVEYSETEAALVELEQRFSGIVPDCSTDEGFESAKKDYKVIRDYEIKLEKLRNDLKAPILERGRLLDGEAKRIDGRLKAISSPFKVQIDAEKKRRKEVEERRVKQIEDRLDGMRNLVNLMQGMEIQELEETIQSLETDEMRGWMEYETKAYETRNNVLAKLNEHLAFLVQKRENEKAIAEERARQKAEAEALEAEREALRKEREELEALRKQQEKPKEVAQDDPVEGIGEDGTTCEGFDEKAIGREQAQSPGDLSSDRRRLLQIAGEADEMLARYDNVLQVCETDWGRDLVSEVMIKVKSIADGVRAKVEV